MAVGGIIGLLGLAQGILIIHPTNTIRYDKIRD